MLKNQTGGKPPYGMCPIKRGQNVECKSIQRNIGNRYERDRKKPLAPPVWALPTEKHGKRPQQEKKIKRGGAIARLHSRSPVHHRH